MRLIALVSLLSACTDSTNPHQVSPATETPVTTAPAGEAVPSSSEAGRLRLLLHDGPAPEVDEVWVAWDEVSVHSEADGWLVVSDTPASVDLLTLQDGVSTELGLTELPPGAYSQIRLHLTDAWVVDDDVERALDVPSGGTSGLKIAHGFTVPECGTLTLSLDWDVGAHLHETGNGQLKLRPVVVVDDASVDESCEPPPLQSGSVDDVADLTIDGTLAGNRLGATLEAVGDLDGDGVTDLFAGARVRPAVFTDLLSRDVDDPTTAQADGGPFLWLEHSGYADDWIGLEVEAGNVGGGPGTDLVFSFYCTPTFTSCKRVYVLFDLDDVDAWPRTDGRIGAIDLASVGWPNAMYFQATTSSSLLGGQDITVHSDVDGDGYDELSMLDARYNAERGRVWVLYGPVERHDNNQDGIVPLTAIDPAASLVLTGTSQEQAFGQSSATSGDFDCDGSGRADLAFGQQGKDAIPRNNSAVTIIPNVWDGSSLLVGSYTIPNDIGVLGGYHGYESYGTALGRAMDAVPAPNGCDDLLVGGPGSSATGRAWWLSSPVDMSGSEHISVQGWSLYDGEPGGRVGQDVAYGGAITGPGSQIVLLGDLLGNRMFLAAAADPSTAPLVTIDGTPSTRFGGTVEALGDINGDGYDDFAVADEGFALEGRIHLFLGGPLAP